MSPEPADEGGRIPSTTSCRRRGGLGEMEPALLAAGLAGVRGFLLSQMFTEPHSTKQIEDAVGWGLETDPETILRGMDAAWSNDEDERARAVRAGPLPGARHPGDAGRDRRAGSRRGRGQAAIPTAVLVTLDGSGHAPHLRDPVRTNLILRDFACPPPPRPRWRRGRSRRRRALYISSPIGLGHAQRDVAIAERAARAASRPGDRLAGPAPGDRGAGRARRADPPGQRVPRQRVGPL